MSSPFYERLRDYLENIGKVLRGEANVATIFPNNSDKGSSRERVYRDFLYHHIPATCHVAFGGFVFSQTGEESKQIDVIVSTGVCPRFNFLNQDGQGKSFACIDGVLGTFSIKSYLDKKELFDSLHNLASLPHQSPLGGRLNPLAPRIEDFEHWPLKVIYASDGLSIETINGHLEEFYTTNTAIPVTRRVDAIHVAGKYVFFNTGPSGGTLNTGERLPPNSLFPQIEGPDAWGLLWVITRLQAMEQSARHLLYGYDFLNRLPVKKPIITKQPKLMPCSNIELGPPRNRQSTPRPVRGSMTLAAVSQYALTVYFEGLGKILARVRSGGPS